MQNTPSITQ